MPSGVLQILIHRLGYTKHVDCGNFEKALYFTSKDDLHKITLRLFQSQKFYVVAAKNMYLLLYILQMK